MEGNKKHIMLQEGMSDKMDKHTGKPKQNYIIQLNMGQKCQKP